MRKIALMISFILALILISGPYALKTYINKRLVSISEKHSFSIDSVSFSLLRGEYSIEKLVFLDRFSGRKILILKKVFFNFSWESLCRKRLGLDLKIEGGELTTLKDIDLNSVDEIEKEKKKTWVKALKAIVPLELNSLVLNDFTFIYRGEGSDEMENLNFYIVDAKAYNLLYPNRGKEGLSSIFMNVTFNNHASINIEGGVDLENEINRFDLDISIKKLKINSFNKILYSYIPIDITRGQLDTFIELKGETRKFKGYSRVFLRDLDIISKDQKFKSVKHVGIEVLSGFSSWLLGEISEQYVAAEIPFNYEGGSIDVASNDIFWSTLNNTYDSLPRKFKASF